MDSRETTEIKKSDAESKSTTSPSNRSSQELVVWKFELSKLWRGVNTKVQVHGIGNTAILKFANRDVAKSFPERLGNDYLIKKKGLFVVVVGIDSQTLRDKLKDYRPVNTTLPNFDLATSLYKELKDYFFLKTAKEEFKIYLFELLEILRRNFGIIATGLKDEQRCLTHFTEQNFKALTPDTNLSNTTAHFLQFIIIKNFEIDAPVYYQFTFTILDKRLYLSFSIQDLQTSLFHQEKQTKFATSKNYLMRKAKICALIDIEKKILRACDHTYQNFWVDVPSIESFLKSITDHLKEQEFTSIFYHSRQHLTKEEKQACQIFAAKFAHLSQSKFDHERKAAIKIYNSLKKIPTFKLSLQENFADHLSQAEKLTSPQTNTIQLERINELLLLKTRLTTLARVLRKNPTKEEGQVPSTVKDLHKEYVSNCHEFILLYIENICLPEKQRDKKLQECPHSLQRVLLIFVGNAMSIPYQYYLKCTSPGQLNARRMALYVANALKIIVDSLLSFEKKLRNLEAKHGAEFSPHAHNFINHMLNIIAADPKLDEFLAKLEQHAPRQAKRQNMLDSNATNTNATDYPHNQNENSANPEQTFAVPISRTQNFSIAQSQATDNRDDQIDGLLDDEFLTTEPTHDRSIDNDDVCVASRCIESIFAPLPPLSTMDTTADADEAADRQDLNWTFPR